MEIEEQRSRIAFRAHLITHSVQRKEGRKQQNPHENDDDKKKKKREKERRSNSREMSRKKLSTIQGQMGHRVER